MSIFVHNFHAREWQIFLAKLFPRELVSHEAGMKDEFGAYGERLTLSLLAKAFRGELVGREE